MTALVVIVVIAVVVWLIVRAGRAKRAVTPPPGPTVPRETPPAVPAAREIPFARAGMKGELFTYGQRQRTATHPSLAERFAVIDLETTGLSPRHGDRVVEVAIATVAPDGEITEEFATLVNPGRDVGATFVHHISNDDVRAAPTFAQIAPEVLARLSDAVVVAHNAPFEEHFLAAEFARLGVDTGRLPGLCTLWLSRETQQLPNHRLRTVAAAYDVPLVDAHAALGDVRAVARLLPILLAGLQRPLYFPAPRPAGERSDQRTWTPITRAPALRRGTGGWMASIMARLPMQSGQLDDATADLYLGLLADAMEDGRILGDEARALAQVAGQAGLGGAEVRALNEQFLEGMRESAFADGVLTPAELRDLTRAATALGIADYFDDLVPDEPITPQKATVRRCGHCRGTGHYRSRCPQLRAVSDLGGTP